MPKREKRKQEKKGKKGKRKQDLVVYTHGKRWMLMNDWKTAKTGGVGFFS